MKKLLLCLLILPSLLFGADAANDLILSQRNSGNTGNTQRNVGASGAITSAATFRSALGIAGTGDNNAFTGANTHTGIESFTAATVKPATAMGALAVDVTKGWNTKTIAVDSTLTFSGTPATANTFFAVLITNSDVAAHTITFPSSFAMGIGTATTTTIDASGKLVLTWQYDGTAYNLYGASPLSTGTGPYVRQTSPTLITPVLGVATATSINGNTFTTGTYTLTGTAGKTLTFTNNITLSGTDGVILTTPTTSFTAARTDAGQTFTGASATTDWTANTKTAGDASTKLSTTLYADTAALATHLGTFASPNTAAGAITWTSPVYNIYTSAGATRTYTLPAASTYVNRAFILNVAVGTGHVNVQPASGAQLVLAGVLLTADHYVQAATSAPGNYICFISDGTNWTSLGSSGTWADASSP